MNLETVSLTCQILLLKVMIHFWRLMEIHTTDSEVKMSLWLSWHVATIKRIVLYLMIKALKMDYLVILNIGINTYPITLKGKY